MGQNGFFFAQASIKNDVEFKQFRLFAERMFSVLGLHIDRYVLSYEAADKKRNNAAYKYASKNKSKFDGFLLSSCRFSTFRAFGKSKEIWDDPIRLHLTHKTGNIFSVHVTWIMQEDRGQHFIQQIELYKQLLDEFGNVQYLLGGCMASEKAVDLFILGMLHDTLTALEKKAAHNIQLAAYRDTRMPYLFPYTYCAAMPETWSFESGADRTVIFRSLILKPLDSYGLHKNWKKYYDMLLEKNLLIPI